MKTILTLTLAIAGMLVSLTSSAAFITKLDVTTTSGPDTATELVFKWDTNVASGTIGSADLTDLTMQVFNGANVIYTDVMIVAGAIQDIAGNTRTGILWDFDLDTSILNVNGFDNDEFTDQGIGSGFSGTSFNIFSGGNNDFFVGRYIDNIFDNLSEYTVNAQNTTVAAAVPVVPTALLMLFAPLLMVRRTRS